MQHIGSKSAPDVLFDPAAAPLRDFRAKQVESSIIQEHKIRLWRHQDAMKCPG
jgi:hypothetical protein